MAETNKYSDVVNYDQMDPFKIACQEAALTTAGNLDRFRQMGITLRENPESRGESAYEIDFQPLSLAPFRQAFVEEGLGTKNVIAAQMRELQSKIALATEARRPLGQSFFKGIGQDNAAMILNDLATRSASPFVFMLHVAAGESSFFTDEERNHDLIEGTRQSCDEVRCVWGGGESPALRDIINVGHSVLSGSAAGIRLLRSGSHYISEKNLTPGLRIFLLASTGPHSNGITLPRTKILDGIVREMGKDPEDPEQRIEGYTYDIGNGQTFGEAMLEPTALYSPVMDLLDQNEIPVEYATHISGHGWRKLMRAQGEFSYIIDKIPEPQTIFRFIQERSGMSDKEIYGDYNMGAGFAFFIRPQYADQASQLLGQSAINAGYVEAGPKRVVINPLGIEYNKDELDLR